MVGELTDAQLVPQEEHLRAPEIVAMVDDPAAKALSDKLYKMTDLPVSSSVPAPRCGHSV